MLAISSMAGRFLYAREASTVNTSGQWHLSYRQAGKNSIGTSCSHEQRLVLFHPEPAEFFMQTYHLADNNYGWRLQIFTFVQILHGTQCFNIDTLVACGALLHQR